MPKLRFNYLVILSYISLHAHAIDSTQIEITHLLASIKSSQCQYERNGTLHSADEAVTHIKRKQDYYRDEIHSAEAFIALAANKSSLSGKSYYIVCEGQPKQKSQNWLLERLKKYRVAVKNN